MFFGRQGGLGTAICHSMKLGLVVLIALLSLPTWGNERLLTLRASAREAQEKSAQLRAEQLRRRNALSQLTSRIEAVKATSKTGTELEKALRQSQELSRGLSDLAQQIHAAQAALDSSSTTLLAALGDELVQLRAQFDSQPDRAIRKTLIENMKRLRVERDALRQAMPGSPPPVLGQSSPTDDPEELLQQADFVRDQHEKLERELAALDARLAERHQEVELDRRVQRFLSEESMFDDVDRRLRVQRSIPRDALPQATSSDNSAAAPQSAGSESAPGSATPFSGQEADATPRVTSGTDARIQMGSVNRLSNSVERDILALEAERNRIKTVTEQLKKRADELEQRAATLKSF
jgi:hypothetical protein